VRASPALHPDRAAFSKVDAYKERMGWAPVSSEGSDFNFDYHVSFTPKEIAERHFSLLCTFPRVPAGAFLFNLI
jgi:predicted dithiol-disulfide oxidoreductase (DUF899 family)